MGELDRVLRMIQGAMAGKVSGYGSMTDLDARNPVGLAEMTENEMMSNPSGYGSMTEMELAQMMRPLGILGGDMLGDVSGLGIVSDRENELMNQVNRRLQQLKELEQQMFLQRLIR
jgi:hypothetical protein